MSRAFVRAPLDQVDGEVNAWLKRVAEIFDLDRTTVAEIDPDTGRGAFTHGWARKTDQMMGPPMDPNKILVWLRERMLSGEPLVYSSVDELPAEATGDIARLGRFLPKSNVTIPTMFAGTVVGAVGFATIYRQRRWTATDVRRLHEVAEILGYALERRRVERESLRLRTELTYLSRVNTMGELVASLAHELNQPLSAILGNAQAIQSLLESETLDLDEIRAAGADVVRDDLRASDIIKRLRAMFRRDALKQEVLDVAEVVSETGRLVGHDARIHNIKFEFAADQRLPAVVGDRVQLQQAIINLVLNAFEAVAAKESGVREVRLEASTPGCDQVMVSVRDSGKGIAADTMQKIFDPFFTTKRGGLGIGLSITRTIVEGHRGRLLIAPNEDQGVTFKIILPTGMTNAD
ncbi:MAG: GAF domain-containing sensor histidine kinase [Candidatus Binataceae bacterium]